MSVHCQMIFTRLCKYFYAIIYLRLTFFFVLNRNPRPPITFASAPPITLNGVVVAPIMNSRPRLWLQSVCVYTTAGTHQPHPPALSQTVIEIDTSLVYKS